MMYSNFSAGWGAPSFIPLFGLWLVVAVVWSIFWKGLALWHSGRRGQYWWFVIMLILNTVGILEIIYLFLVIGLRPSELFTIHGRNKD